MHVVGTAGHVDHGKSSLVNALTGIHPDRLKEEIQREMTIELGFAWMDLPDTGAVGIVDVPGHRDFIENMLAGVGGIDAVIFVIAADEGIMPQTKEHLAILNILQIQGGVIALTKIDLVSDQDWLLLVEEEIKKTVQGTILKNAPIVRVSSKTGEGLEAIKKSLSEILRVQPVRPDLGRPRLPIDRVFTITGFGTIVTGTLLDGSLHTGDDIEILPEIIRGRIRGLQSHKSKEEQILPGSRTAVNISGVNADEIKRGDILVTPGKYRSTQLIDVSFSLLGDVSAPLRHNSEVKFFLGAAEILARIRVLGREELKPGEKGFLQLELKKPVVAVRNDHYILRKPSPGETLGGGIVVDPFPVDRHKRNDADIQNKLATLEQGDPEEIILAVIQKLVATTRTEIIKSSRLEENQGRLLIIDLISRNKIVVLTSEKESGDADVLVRKELFEGILKSALEEIRNYHIAYPLKRGMPREALKSKLNLDGKLFQPLMRKWAAESTLTEIGPFIAAPEHKVAFSEKQNDDIKELMARFEQSPYSPPTVKECKGAVGEEIYNLLVNSKEITPVSDEVVFRALDYQQLIYDTQKEFALKPQLTLAEFRDRIKTSRRYAQAFLEHLDAIGITIREGDTRKLHKT